MGWGGGEGRAVFYVSGWVLCPDVSVFVPGMSGASICLAVCRLSNKGLGLGRMRVWEGWMEMCGRRGSGGSRSWRGRGHPSVSPPSLPEAAPDWLLDCRAQVTFASGAERGRATREHC